MYYVGLDLGQLADFTALAAVEVMPREDAPRRYQCRHLERLPLSTSYPAVVSHVVSLLATPPLAGNCELVVDATGVGVAVTDLLRDAGLSFTSVTLTGGDVVNQDPKDRTIYRVPKRDTIMGAKVLLQSGRLKLARGMELVDLVTQELINYKVRIDPKTAHDSYGAGAEWREGNHDDLMFALCLACWRAENPPMPITTGFLKGVGATLRRHTSILDASDWAGEQDDRIISRARGRR